MIFAILLAGGSGSRLAGIPTPKQYLNLGGMTLLERVAATFLHHQSVDCLVVVVPPSDIEKVSLMFIESRKPVMVVPGGSSRQASSRSGVFALQDNAGPEDIVLIHDAARVLVTSDVIDRAIAALEGADAATAAIKAQDTLMKASSDTSVGSTIDRSDIIMAQTPQAFRYRVIKTAHERAVDLKVTDDVSLVLGTVPVRFFPGSPLNFKVTTNDDLLLLKALIASEPRS
ncbi:MAG: 2-C-methyl-D-erythritol 4-phosphate cytidylyltransferase [Bacilli bacterium]|jgi:2-C-methyl-D-erythritol 4-phosphate cytidylyltransferase